MRITPDHLFWKYIVCIITAFILSCMTLPILSSVIGWGKIEKEMAFRISNYLCIAYYLGLLLVWDIILFARFGER